MRRQQAPEVGPVSLPVSCDGRPFGARLESGRHAWTRGTAEKRLEVTHRHLAWATKVYLFDLCTTVCDMSSGAGKETLDVLGETQTYPTGWQWSLN